MKAYIVIVYVLHVFLNLNQNHIVLRSGTI